jgi:hypothetical protein
MENNKNYYNKIATQITQKFNNKISQNYDYYNGFLNSPITKNLIRLKYDIDLNSLPSTKLFDILVDKSLSTLIFSSIKKQKLNDEIEIHLNDQYENISVNKIINILNIISNKQYSNISQQELNEIRYMYIGGPHFRIISKLLNIKNTINDYLGEFNGIKIYYINNLTDIYISNAPYIDLSTIDIKYNEYIKEQYKNSYNLQTCVFENVENFMKNATITLNCELSDIRIIKLKTVFDDDKNYIRYMKIKNILKKNEIHI